MPNSTEFDDDLVQLQIKHSLDADFIHALAKSPLSIQKNIWLYKVFSYVLNLSFVLVGLCFILYSFLSANQHAGIISGMVGAVMAYHFSNGLFKTRKAMKEIERVARYHHLL